MANIDRWVMSKDREPLYVEMKDGVMTVSPETGDKLTKQKFGDCPLHVEFKFLVNAKNSVNHNNDGNSGVYMLEWFNL